MNFLIMHQTVTRHDAIGNDIEAMYNILCNNHYCRVYAQNRLNDKVEYINEEQLYNVKDDKDSIIIYHHSVFWEFGETIINTCSAKLIIRYHNITPPEFFVNYNKFHFEQCDKGREQTIRFAKKLNNAFWLVDSLYNAKDIKEVENKRIAICPPFNKIESWAKDKPDEKILKTLIYDTKINLLFVGRIAPNKGHMFLIDVIHNYCENFDTNIKLRIIGKFDDQLPGYNQKIKDKIKYYGLEDYIEFIGEINDQTLMSYYMGSDFFICASEHEGFCVPIPEAQYFQLPIITRSSSAVPETIGIDQILLGEDIKKYSAAIKLLFDNKDYYDFICEKGLSNFMTRFSFDKIYERFKDILYGILGVEV